MTRIDEWFGVDDGWERPGPTPRQRRVDLLGAVIALAVVALGAESMRSLGAFVNEPHGVVWQYVAMVSLAALVAFRRSHPVLVTALSGLHLVIASIVLPMTVSQLPVQLLAFFLIFSGVAWARDRRMVQAALALVIISLFLSIAWFYALSSGLEELVAQFEEDVPEQIGLFTIGTAWTVLSLLSNALFFGGATLLGQVAWNGARHLYEVEAQSETIAEQSTLLRDQAVVTERLRIARELHDVVAHHVSVMGVQASAGRRVMARDPGAAEAAFTAVEQASRDAVGQMRDLLGTLRSDGVPGSEDGMPSPSASGPAHRAPQPTLADLEALAASASTPTCDVTMRLVESAPGAAGRVPPPVQLSAYRIVQESLANVHKHSTARQAQAVVRVDEEANQLEVEVVDDGTPRPGTSGTGLGLRGMRERAEHLGGGVEVGPRMGARGWRVRVWFPLEGRGERRAREDSSN